MPKQVNLSEERAEQVRQAAAGEHMNPDEWVDRELQRSLRRRQLEAFTGPDEDTRAWMRTAHATSELIWSQTAAGERTGR